MVKIIIQNQTPQKLLQVFQRFSCFWRNEPLATAKALILVVVLPLLRALLAASNPLFLRSSEPSSSLVIAFSTFRPPPDIQRAFLACKTSGFFVGLLQCRKPPSIVAATGPFKYLNRWKWCCLCSNQNEGTCGGCFAVCGGCFAPLLCCHCRFWCLALDTRAVMLKPFNSLLPSTPSEAE